MIKKYIVPTISLICILFYAIPIQLNWFDYSENIVFMFALWMTCSVVLVPLYFIMLIIDLVRKKPFNRYRLYALLSMILVWVANVWGASKGANVFLMIT